jgi:hypothetical protein
MCTLLTSNYANSILEGTQNIIAKFSCYLLPVTSEIYQGNLQKGLYFWQIEKRFKVVFVFHVFSAFLQRHIKNNLVQKDISGFYFSLSIFNDKSGSHFQLHINLGKLSNIALL